MARPISVLPDYEAFIDRMIATGRYDTAGDVVMEALSLLEDREAGRQVRVARMRAQIDEGLEDLKAGRTVPAEQVFSELRAMIDRARSSQEAAECS